MNKNELYFCLNLTENEHYIVEDMIQQECKRLDCNLKYYRELKDGHVPMFREVKICGEYSKLNLIKKFLDDKLISNNIEDNPHRPSFHFPVELELKNYIERPIFPKRVKAIQINNSNENQVKAVVKGYRPFYGDWLVMDENDKYMIYTDFLFKKTFVEYN